MRSLIFSRCGLVKVPTFNPVEINNWLNARAVEVFPFVPVRWTTGWEF